MQRPPNIKSLASCILLLSLANDGFADRTIYKWVDNDGVVHFSESPPDVRSEELTLDVDGPPPEHRTQLATVRRDSLPAVDASSDRYSDDVMQVRYRELCMTGRRDYEVLGERLPVYRTSDGELRVHWSADTHEGARDYLDDQARVAAENEALYKIANFCSDPLDAEDQQLARDQWIESDLCESAKHNLSNAERPGSRSAREYIERLRRQVERYCD